MGSFGVEARGLGVDLPKVTRTAFPSLKRNISGTTAHGDTVAYVVALHATLSSSATKLLRA